MTDINQEDIVAKISSYLKNRGREDFAAQLSPGYCHGLTLLFCYFANIKKIDAFYRLLKRACKWNEDEDDVMLNKTRKIRATIEWQQANTKFNAFESQLPKTSQQSYFDNVNEAKRQNFLTQDEAHLLLSATLPDDVNMEKILNLMETLQRLDKYQKILASGAKLELIRDNNPQSTLFSKPYENIAGFGDAIIPPKGKLSDLIEKLPADRGVLLCSGRHVFAIIKEQNIITLYDSNDDEIQFFNSENGLIEYILSEVYDEMVGSHIPIGIEIHAQTQQEASNYKDLKLFCDAYRKNENASFVITGEKDDYPADGMTPLILAILANLPNVIDILIKENSGLNTKDGLGFHPIHYAAYKGLTDLMLQLIDKGVDVNQEIAAPNAGILTKVALSLHDSIRFATPLFIACVVNNIEMVTLLLEKGADINKDSMSGLTPLVAAIRQGNRELVRLLIKHGAKLDTHIYIFNDKQYKKKKTQDPTPLELYGAIYLPDYEGFNCAMVAAKEKQTEIILDLLNAGVNVNYANKHGLNLLHLCVKKGILNQEILNYKPDVNSLVKFDPDSNELISSLWIACYNHNYEMVELLLKNGANPNIQSKFELSPLVKAVENGSLELVQLLLNHGADLEVTSGNHTLLDIAADNGHTHLGFIISIYVDLRSGKFSTATELANGLTRTLDSLTKPATHFTMYPPENNDQFKKLSDLLKNLTDPTFDTIKEKMQETLKECKPGSNEAKFLKALDRFTDDWQFISKISVNASQHEPPLNNPFNT